MSLFTQLKLGLNKYIKKRIKRTPSVFYLYWPTLWVQTLAKIHTMILNIPISSPAWNLCCIYFGFGQILKIKFKIPEKTLYVPQQIEEKETALAKRGAITICIYVCLFARHSSIPDQLYEVKLTEETKFTHPNVTWVRKEIGYYFGEPLLIYHNKVLSVCFLRDHILVGEMSRF